LKYSTFGTGTGSKVTQSMKTTVMTMMVMYILLLSFGKCVHMHTGWQQFLNWILTRISEFYILTLSQTIFLFVLFHVL